MKKYYLIPIFFISLLFWGCETKPDVPTPPREYRGVLFQNDCLPKAIMMKEGLDKCGIESKVLVMSFPNGKGHAVTVYLYPDPDVRWRSWVWDEYWGSVRVVALFDDPVATAQDWLNRFGFRSMGTNQLLSATYL